MTVTAMPIPGINVRWKGWWLSFKVTPKTNWLGLSATNGLGEAPGPGVGVDGDDGSENKQNDILITQHDILIT